MRLEILTFEKYRDLETRIRSHWRSLEMSPFDSAHATSYWCSIVNMALSSVVSEIFNVENLLTLKSGSEITQAHWKLYRSIDLVCFPISSNFVPKTHHFWDIRLVRIQWPWNPGYGSLKVIGTDTDRSIVTMGLSLTVSDTNGDFGRKSPFFHSRVRPPLTKQCEIMLLCYNGTE